MLTSGKALEKSWVHLYEQLSGHEATFDNAEGEVCLSATKRPRKGTLLKIVDKVSIVKGKVSIPHEIAKALQCSYAKVVVSPCCQQVWPVQVAIKPGAQGVIVVHYATLLHQNRLNYEDLMR